MKTIFDELDRLQSKISALPKKMWSHDLKQDYHTLRAELERLHGVKIYIHDGLFTNTPDGEIVGLRFSSSERSDPSDEYSPWLTRYGGYLKVNDKIVFNQLDTKSYTDKEISRSSNVPSSVWKKLELEIERYLAKHAKEVTLPNDLLKALAPKLDSFQVPTEVRNEKERSDLLSALVSIWHDAREEFLKLLSPSEAPMVEAEIDSVKIRAKKTSKNPYAKRFFSEVAPSFVAIQEKIKELPRNAKKEVRDTASGLALGEKVEFEHPKHGRIEGKVEEFKDGKIGIRHKNYDRAKYYVVGTTVTFVDPSVVKYIGKWRGPTHEVSKANINALEKTLRSVIDRIHNDIVEFYSGEIKKELDQIEVRMKADTASHRGWLKLMKETRIRSLPSFHRRSEEWQHSEIERAHEEVDKKKDIEILYDALSDLLRGSSYPNMGGFFEGKGKNWDKSDWLPPTVIKNPAPRIKAMATEIAEAMGQEFVSKQLAKLSSIIDQRKDFSKVFILNDWFKSGAIEADIKCEFGEDSFVAHTILVRVINSKGTSFYRYPTTFHDIVIEGEKIKKMDEKWMNEVFAKSKDNKTARILSEIIYLEGKGRA